MASQAPPPFQEAPQQADIGKDVGGGPRVAGAGTYGRLEAPAEDDTGLRAAGQGAAGPTGPEAPAPATEAADLPVPGLPHPRSLWAEALGARGAEGEEAAGSPKAAYLQARYGPAPATGMRRVETTAGAGRRGQTEAAEGGRVLQEDFLRVVDEGATFE
eukprot:scaffold4.g4752.t1